LTAIAVFDTDDASPAIRNEPKITLELLQGLVGGFIEEVIAPELSAAGVMAFVRDNDEWLATNVKTVNGHMYAGPLVFAGRDDEGNCVDLGREQQDIVNEWCRSGRSRLESDRSGRPMNG
jgi:hypothetical protein